MKDATFKRLRHVTGALKIVTRGGQVATGYKPDVTIENKFERLKIILESEQKTDRKAFLGDFIKAEKHASTTNSKPVLIIVMREEGNTSVLQIVKNLRPYKRWLRKLKGAPLSLSRIYVISDTDYRASKNKKELLTSKQFRKRCVVV